MEKQKYNMIAIPLIPAKMDTHHPNPTVPTRALPKKGPVPG
jgi:hypothetical protein